jgi:A/G-specific adenine glycosylase
MALTAAQKEIVSQRVLSWYDSNARELPWRLPPRSYPPSCNAAQQAQAYQVLVSELMLQQTQVKRVKPRFEAWVNRWPSLSDLALSASEDDVTRAWAGLGYYNRAKNLLKICQTIHSHHAGNLPSTRVKLQSLKGIGSYTASAISSIAFGEPVGAVDANVVRVLSRLCNLHLTKEAGFEQYQQIADELAFAASSRASDWNPALMDLGATVCTPKAPKCSECPLKAHCAAYNDDSVCVEDLPPKQAKPERRLVQRRSRVLRARIHGTAADSPDKKYVLLCKRPCGVSLLAGLWEFPSIDDGTSADIDALLKHEGIQYDLPEKQSCGRVQDAGEVSHTFSHIQQQTQVEVQDALIHSPSNVDVESGKRIEEAQWIPESDIPKFGLSSGPMKVWKQAQLILNSDSGRHRQMIKKRSRSNKSSASSRNINEYFSSHSAADKTAKKCRLDDDD